METAESPLDVLSRAAVMIQRNVLPPPSYDEARSLSQQQKQKLQTRYKTSGLSDDSDDSNAGISSSYDQASSAVSVTNSISGKWKRDKKYQHKAPVTVSACDSTLNGYKIGARFNARSSSNLENGSEPLDMSKRSATKNRGEPPSYFQSILNSNYGLRLADLSKSVVAVQEEKSPSTSTTTVTEDKESTMCDQVINEHFRRSLGRDYANVFSANNKSKTTTKRNRTSAAADSEKTSDDGAAAATNGVADADELDDQSTVSRAHRIDDDDDDSDVETADTIQNSSASTLSVDDHFAKALGDTWIKLQQQERRHNRNQNANHADDED